jgi:hypothetical protein
MAVEDRLVGIEIDPGQIALDYIKVGCPFGANMDGLMRYAVGWFEHKFGFPPALVFSLDENDQPADVIAVNPAEMERIEREEAAKQERLARAFFGNVRGQAQE